MQQRTIKGDSKLVGRGLFGGQEARVVFRPAPEDSGIVFLPDGRKYVLVLLSKELKDFEEGTALLAEVSEVVYNYMQ